jgi:CheY-like chemotaxis protein
MTGVKLAAPRLLVIDDEPDVGTFVARVAESCGYQTRAIELPGAFRAAYAEFKPDVVVLDLAIPGTDGIELLRDLADLGCKAQVLLISGFDRRVLESAERLGIARGLRMAGVISKPVRAAELRRLLANLSKAA